jgi:hypothetical protein
MPKRKIEFNVDDVVAELMENPRSEQRGNDLSGGDFAFDDGHGNLELKEADKNKMCSFRLTDYQHTLWKEWCVRNRISQSAAFLEAFQLLRNKRGA